MKAPLTATLVWTGDRRFSAKTPLSEIMLDGDGTRGPSPMEALAMALAGCMAIDVADIVLKGRYEMTALEVSIAADRSDSPPSRLLGVSLHYLVSGAAPETVVARAIQLSRDKYCSVWHSLRQDIAFTTTFEIRA